MFIYYFNANIIQPSVSFLVSIPDEETNSFVAANFASDGYENRPWLGGYRTGAGKTDFAWTDGSAWNYSKFSPANPDNPDSQKCVSMYTNGTWDDNTCSGSLKFVCQVPSNRGNNDVHLIAD